MANWTLETRAAAAGIEVEWIDAYGAPRRLADSTLQGLLDAMRWPSPDTVTRTGSRLRGRRHATAQPAMMTAETGGSVCLPIPVGKTMPAILRDETGAEYAIRIDELGRFQAPHRPGYYDLLYDADLLRLAVAPARCFGIADRLGVDPSRRRWGLAAQVYSLRREGDGGVGDSSAVATLARSIGHADGDALALSPMHAVKRTAAVYSPYTPSHRGFLDWIYADPAQVFGPDAVQHALENAGIARSWSHAQSASLIDWPAAFDLRRKLWRQLHQQFKQNPGSLHDDLLAFAQHAGEPLRTHARIVAREALRTAQQPHAATRSATATAMPEAFASEVEFEIFAQWVTTRCWQKTQQIALDAGQGIGLIWDMAVGCDPSSSEAWAYRSTLLDGMELGAPPDAFNADGQSWGVTTYSPWGLKAAGFQPFIDLLRANMGRGGGIRIDHVCGLHRLWVLPQGQAANLGGYLKYPGDDLLRLLALESWRNQCVVIGEDLGTVPLGMRKALAARGVLGTDVLLFMRGADGAFLGPSQWRKEAVATTTTHDLPPLLGWRAALDIEHRTAAHAWPETQTLQQRQLRRTEVEQLDHALSRWQPHREHASPDFANQACIDFLFDTPAQLVLVPIDDVLDRKEQPNLPGTVQEYPNWRHRLPMIPDTQLQSALRNIHRRPPGATTP